MTQRDERSFAIGASVALGIGLAASLVVAAVLQLSLAWTVAGWVVLAAIGMWQGVRSARLLGTPGPALVKTLGIGLALRGVLLLGVGAMAVLGDRNVAFGAIAGMAGAFAPLFLFESYWFVKRSAAAVPGSTEA